MFCPMYACTIPNVVVTVSTLSLVFKLGRQRTDVQSLFSGRIQKIVYGGGGGAKGANAPLLLNYFQPKRVGL
jgi:hypothetical protein